MDIYIFVFCVCWRTYLSCPSPLLPERLLLITPHHHTCQHITLLTMAKGSWKRSCPPVVISDCNRNLSTPWISESKNGLASEDPLSQSTVCNGIQGDYHYGVTSENQAEHVSLYYPIQQVGFPRISLYLQGTKQGRLLGHIKIQTRWFRERMGTMS